MDSSKPVAGEADSPVRTMTNEEGSLDEKRPEEGNDAMPSLGDSGTKTASSPPHSPSKPIPAKQEHWLQQTEQRLPKNNLYIVFSGLMLTVFLSALDQTIVSTALPTISASLKSSASGYSWVGSAYLLASTAVIPLYGRMSDLVGRKPMLWLAMALFLFGSAMCGAAQNITWLCICRGVQGLGGGGTISLANIMIGDLVPLKDRGSYAGLYGFVWGLASVLGPILGGVISQHSTWRWCFFLNLPVGGAAFLVLFFRLNLNPQEKRSIRQYVREFDTTGYLIVLSAIVIFLLGFTFAETDGFESPKAIACIVVGACLFPVFIAFEFYIEKKMPLVKPIVPPRLFRTRTTTLILVCVACHSLGFFATAYYLPLYYQAVTGSSATKSAVQMLPFSLGSSLVSAGSGFLVSYIGHYRVIIWSAFALYTLGMGLMTMMDAHTSKALQEVFPLIAGLGLGCLFQTPLVALSAAMPQGQMATSVASFALVRTAAGTAGITIAGSIFNSGVRSRLSNIPGYSGASSTHADLRSLVHIQPHSLALQVVDAYGDAIRLIWIVLTPVVGFGFLSSLGIKGYSMKRRIVQEESPATSPTTDVEKQGEGREEEEDSKDSHADHENLDGKPHERADVEASSVDAREVASLTATNPAPAVLPKSVVEG